jgi:hypothetical protein
MVRVFASQASRDWAHALDDTLERWRLRHQVNETTQDILFMSLEELRQYLGTLSRQSLIDLKAEVETINNAIKVQQKINYEKRYKNPEWVRSSNKVKAICKSYSQIIQSVLSDRKTAREEKRLARAEDINREFVTTAKEMLPKETFKELFEEVYKRLGI